MGNRLRGKINCIVILYSNRLLRPLSMYRGDFQFVIALLNMASFGSGYVFSRLLFETLNLRIDSRPARRMKYDALKRGIYIPS